MASNSQSHAFTFRLLAVSVLHKLVDVRIVRAHQTLHRRSNILTSNKAAPSPGMLALHIMTGRPVPQSVLAGMPAVVQRLATTIAVSMRKHTHAHMKTETPTLFSSSWAGAALHGEEAELDHLLLIDVAVHLRHGAGDLHIISLEAPTVVCVLYDIARSARTQAQARARARINSDKVPKLIFLDSDKEGAENSEVMHGCLLLIQLKYY